MSKKTVDTEVHTIRISETMADRIHRAGIGVLIEENIDHQFQKGDLVKFIVTENYFSSLETMHDIDDEVYAINSVYSGRGVEQRFVVLLVTRDSKKGD